MLPSHLSLKWRPSVRLATTSRPGLVTDITTSPDPSRSGTCEIDDHQTTFGLISSSLRKVRSIPAGFRTVGWTWSGGTPSASRANSRGYLEFGRGWWGEGGCQG